MEWNRSNKYAELWIPCCDKGLLISHSNNLASSKVCQLFFFSLFTILYLLQYEVVRVALQLLPLKFDGNTQSFTQWIYASIVFSAMFWKLKHFMLDCLSTPVVNGLNEVLDASMGLKSPCVMLLISNFVVKNTSVLFFSIHIGLYVSIFLICCDCVHVQYVQHALT